ncbi:MAG: hypothetical protein ACJ763_07820 [Bdellovibrionia bacterium]
MSAISGPSSYSPGHSSGQASLALAASLLCLGLTTGCGKQASPDPAESFKAPLSSHRTLEGSLESNVRKIVESQQASVCDYLWRNKALKIARALDSRESEITQALEARPTSSSYRRISLPPTYAREAIVKFEAQPGWQEYDVSWSDLYNDYLKIKDHPTDRFWISLNSNVRSLISDDQERVEGYNVYFDKNSIPRLEKAIQKMDQCIQKSSCTTPVLESDVEAFVKSITVYNSYWELIQQETNTSKKRETEKEFSDQMKADLNAFGFRVNKSVSLKNGELLLPLDPGPFAPSTGLLSKTIESIWSSKSLKLKIQWTSSNLHSEIFRLLLGSTPDDRSYVLGFDKTVHLFPDVRLSAIAHEIGHVLGFKDHYYTVWHPEQCGYIIQTNDEDLMSDPDTGTVTSDEWNELKARYSR